jgi:putative ABC transport system permease protein
MTRCLIVLTLTLTLNVPGTIEPWFQPRTWIPVAGVLLGNTLSATTLGALTITIQFANHQDQVELCLARGATSCEAILPLTHDTLLTALTPTINGLAVVGHVVTGIVHIPGMMTG